MCSTSNLVLIVDEISCLEEAEDILSQCGPDVFLIVIRTDVEKEIKDFMDKRCIAILDNAPESLVNKYRTLYMNIK